MTDMQINSDFFQKHVGRGSPFVIEDVFWGYKVISRAAAPVSLMLGQVVSFFFGVCLLTATFGVLVLPTLFFDGDGGFVRIGAAVVMGAIGFYLLWFASRGTVADIHVDTRRRHIREVVENRFGGPTTVGLHSFDQISGIFLEFDEVSAQTRLLLGYNDSANAIVVATGTEAQLLPLRDQLVHDLLGDNAVADG